jgi:hypothetical protein
MSTVHSTFIYDPCVQTHKMEVALKPWDIPPKIGKIPADEKGVA